MEELDKEILYDIDLFIGVVGKSIIKEDLLEEIVLHSRQQNLFFASGSTKTVEFTDLENWLHRLSMEDCPKIAGRSIRIKTEAVRDVQTGLLQGNEITVSFDDQLTPDRKIFLLAGMTPINLLYYGIPCEIIDTIMSQLLRVSIGLVERYRSGDRLPSRLLAVDHEIDMDANLIKKSQLSQQSPTPWVAETESGISIGSKEQIL